jgi:hypothetical protein
MNQSDAQRRADGHAGSIHGQPPAPPAGGKRGHDDTDGARAGSRPADPNASGIATPADERDRARMSSEGGTEGQVGDTSGPGAGYDGEPRQVKDEGGVV